MNNVSLTSINEIVDGENMIRISMGTESMLVSVAYARQIAEYIKNTANLTEELKHIDNVFDNWNSGYDGGTC